MSNSHLPKLLKEARIVYKTRGLPYVRFSEVKKFGYHVICTNRFFYVEEDALVVMIQIFIKKS
jgi:hypothetical protein